MPELKKLIHSIAIAIFKLTTKLLPDRIPLTFVGTDSFRQLCRSIAQIGVKKVLIVTDAGLVQIGLVAKVSEVLKDCGVEWTIYDGVEPDPTFDHVSQGLSLYRSESCDGILAVGGGSPMDAAKVIAAGATSAKPFARLEGLLKVRQAPAPWFAIPTTAGTGSEVTIAAVISEPDTHTKKFFIDPKLLPSMAALDPALMSGLPPQITAATGMDALTHAVESYLASTSTKQSESFAIAAVKLVFSNLQRAYSEGSDLEARNAMALGSFYAGAAFTRTGVGYVHAIAHAFGAYYRTPHGLANAIVLPHVLEYSRDPARKRLASLADAIGIEGSSDYEKASKFIDAVRELMRSLDIPDKLDALKSSDIAPIATQALKEAFSNYPVPRLMTQEECESLLRRIMT